MSFKITTIWSFCPLTHRALFHQTAALQHCILARSHSATSQDLQGMLLLLHLPLLLALVQGMSLQSMCLHLLDSLLAYGFCWQLAQCVCHHFQCLQAASQLMSALARWLHQLLVRLLATAGEVLEHFLLAAAHFQLELLQHFLLHHLLHLLCLGHWRLFQRLLDKWCWGGTFCCRSGLCPRAMSLHSATSWMHAASLPKMSFAMYHCSKCWLT